MAEQDQQDKTEEPTEQKLKKARDEGNVAKSTEVASVMLMVTAILIALYSGNWIYDEFSSLFRQIYLNLDQPFNDNEHAIQVLQSTLITGFKIIGPMLIGLLVVAVLSHVLQGGFILAPKVMEPKPDRIHPGKGFKKIFSTKGLAELIKGLTKVFIVGVIIYSTFKGKTDDFAIMIMLPVSDTLSQTGAMILTMMTRILTALVVLAIADAIYERYQHRKDLKMTRQEVRDELKQSEGDPHMKSKRKEKAKSFRHRKRLDHAILASDVVVTNPTHYAVALQYNPDSNRAPIVQAKGMRKRALKIRSFAAKYEVPVIENPPVARALFASTEEDQIIPEEYFKVVAEILAYVYRLKEEKTNIHEHVRIK